MRRHREGHILVDESDPGYLVIFEGLAGYCVLPEVVQSTLGLEYAEACHLTTSTSGRMIDFFDFRDLYPTDCIVHHVLRTAHFCVNVFSSVDPRVHLLG
jgi:hypothetical protein